MGNRLPSGYGTTGKSKIGETGTTTAHRMAYILTHGPVPVEHDVCHHCDNPPCCNPAHLFDGSRSENMQDCVAKGRRNIERQVRTYLANHPLCPAGHAYDGEKDGHRFCTECRRIRLGGTPERQRAYVAKPRKRKPLTREERDVMRSQHSAGATPRELSERWRVGYSTALSIVKGHGSYEHETAL